MLNENDYHYGWRSATIHNRKTEQIGWMNHSVKALLGILLCIFVLGGCGSAIDNHDVDSKISDPKDDTFSQIAAAEISGVSEGLEEMTSKIKQFKQVVEADQHEEAKVLADELAALWHAVQQDIKSQDAERGEALQEDLEALYKETQNEAWDKELLIQLDYKLYQSLRDMKATWDSE